jgi:hypothetical protein
MGVNGYEKIIETIGEIPEEKLQDLLTVVEDFEEKNPSRTGDGKWDRFFGIISREEADAMLAVIEETCERIDYV